MTGSQLQIFASSDERTLTHGLYSVKKRLLLPRWWLKGVFCTSREKSALCQAYLRNRPPGLIAGITIPNLRVFYSVAQFWSQVTKQMFISEELAQGSMVKVPINELFSGTRADQLSSFEFFRQAVTTPFCFQVAKSSITSHQRQPVRGSGMSSKKPAFEALLTSSLLRKLELNQEGCVLAEFLTSVRSVVEGSCFENPQSEVHSSTFEPDGDPLIVTLNPSVLKWYGEKSSINKLALYFFLELEKNRQMQQCGSGFSSMLKDIHAQHAQEFFKELLSKASGLYDHGVLGWSDAAPPGRVADYLQNDYAKTPRPLGCVQVVSLSDHLGAVARFEHSLDEKFFARNMQPVVAESSSFQKAAKPSRLLQVNGSGGGRGAVLRRMALKSNCGCSFRTEPRRSAPYRNSVDSSFKDQVFRDCESKPRDQEKEYVLKLAQYYESLSPSQRRDLDLEMKMRTPTELREWLKPLLERLH